MRPTLLVLVVLLLLSACGGGTPTTNAPTTAPASAPTQVSAPTTASAPASTPAPAPTTAPAAAGQFDPRAAEPCAVFTPDELAAITGVPLLDAFPGNDRFFATCAYVFNDQDQSNANLGIDLRNPGAEAFAKVIQFNQDSGKTVEQIDIGERAAIVESDGEFSLYAVVNGWNVTLYGYKLSREEVIAIGQLLADRLVPFTPPPAGDVANQPAPQSGALIGMEVVIEEPANMAGVTTLESLNIVSIAGFAMCSFDPAADPFIVSFIARPGEDPPTPVGVFTLSASGGVKPNQPSPASFEVGLGRSDEPQMFAGEGTVVVAADGKSGTFEAGRLKGRWSCTFSE
ncbi:hypothetical protein [Chloroflexus sp.]|uniref:hypothetical protein n=1 Tax=Chloroflexus sp. TaxID=1904827 RepID=UPI002ACE73CF|nr:hypothetical protein [Chloroflexus sp.]